MNTENHKEILAGFLADHLKNPEVVLEKLSAYYRLLVEANRRVNLISRKQLPETIWLQHFYDSLLPLAYGFDFRGKKIMDFGTGGGLPGIPLAIVYPEASFVLVDSRAKKIFEVDKMIKKLDLINCSVLCERIEKNAFNNEANPAKTGIYDVILCRSVKMTASLLKELKSLLKVKGFLLLYKAKLIEEDLNRLEVKVYDEHEVSWRERKLVRIDLDMLKRELEV